MVQLLGAKVIFPKKAVSKISIISASAKQYASKKIDRILIPFGLDSPKIKEIYKQVLAPLSDLVAPSQIFVAAGSTVIAQTLASIFPETEMHLVQVGKKIWPDQVPGAVIHVHPARFKDKCTHVPPYDTPLTYDGKVWDILLGQPLTAHSCIWSTAGNITEARVRQFIATTDAAISATKARIARFIATKPQFPYISAAMPPPDKMFGSLRKMATAMPPSDVVVSNFSTDYMAATGISNHFTCTARMRCVVKRTGMSPEEYWRRNRARACEYVVRYEGVFGASFHPECNTFNPLILTNLIKSYFPDPAAVHVLDGAAGYGDRLAASLAMEVAEYTGYDPNGELKAGLTGMAFAFGGATKVNLYFTKYAPDSRKYDLAILSPPFFDQEIYPGSENDVCSGLDVWVRSVYSPMLSGMAASLKPGGIMAVYVDNIPRTGPLADITREALCGAGLVSVKRLAFVSRVVEPSGYLKEGCERSLWVYMRPID
jgi:hypothetical protein